MRAFLKNKKLQLLVGIILCALSLILCMSRILFPLDKLISDPLVQRPGVPDPRIKIIAIDERTMAEYGDTTGWTRGIYADLTRILNSSANGPAVIAYDILFISDKDPDYDAWFAEECDAGDNVVTAANIVYQDDVSWSEDGIMVDSSNIAMVELPYPMLRETVRYGFANPVQDKDGYIRSAQLVVDHEGQELDSLSLSVYRLYTERTGTELHFPQTYGNNQFDYIYTGTSGSYETISMCDVLDGIVPPEAFEDAIVFVGAYAPGMQDSYNVPNQKGSQMYGVEIHANILQAMMDGHTGIPVDRLLYAVIVTLIAMIFFLATDKMKQLASTILLVVLGAGSIVVCTVLCRNGHTVPMIDLPILLILTYLYQLVKNYLTEVLRRQKVLSAFKQYVAPQVVDRLSKEGDFEIRLGGEKRDIAVLFVDIRGFTPMSEGLEPEAVVEILNEYLALTTKSIFKNGGTLDKFIGDATMAVFNAPIDLDDYIYRAVCTARDIAAGSDELSIKLMERFGKTISFGIGVNCGPAVVGNIGCDFRMDYTAIGDTVNTAARLESNAKKGQILISQAVYEAIKDRLEVTEIGTIPLKGKQNQINVYQVDRVL